MPHVTDEGLLAEAAPNSVPVRCSSCDKRWTFSGLTPRDMAAFSETGLAELESYCERCNPDETEEE